MKKLVVLMAMLFCTTFAAGMFAGCSSEKPRETPDIRVSVIEGSDAPLIGQDHPGSADNIAGYENGYTIKIGDTTHMAIVEMFVDGNINGQGAWSPARIGYWTSTDGVNFTRQSTLVQGNAIAGSPKENTWSPSFYWVEEENAWSLFWRGAAAVFRYVSETPGKEGIGGPYREKTMIGHKDIQGTIQWGGGIPASWGNIYTGADGKLYTFYSDPHTSGDWNWLAGLVCADDLDGPWSRIEDYNDPTFRYCENPYVIQEGKHYYCVYDDLSCQKSIGVGFSEDGVHWNAHELDLSDYVPWSAENWYVDSVRTPCGLIPEGGGVYSVYFTAKEKDRPYFSVGKIKLKIEEIAKPDRSKDLIAADSDQWEKISGRWSEEFGEISVHNYGKPYYLNAINRSAENFEFEADVRYVVSSMTEFRDGAYAGLFFGKRTLDADDYENTYFVTLSENKKIELFCGGEKIGTVDVPHTPYIFKNLRVRAENGNVQIFYEHSSTPIFEFKDVSLGECYVGLVSGESHWHYKDIYLKKL